MGQQLVRGFPRGAACSLSFEKGVAEPIEIAFLGFGRFLVAQEGFHLTIRLVDLVLYKDLDSHSSALCPSELQTSEFNGDRCWTPRAWL